MAFDLGLASASRDEIRQRECTACGIPGGRLRWALWFAGFLVAITQGRHPRLESSAKPPCRESFLRMRAIDRARWGPRGPHQSSTRILTAGLELVRPQVGLWDEKPHVVHGGGGAIQNRRSAPIRRRWHGPPPRAPSVRRQGNGCQVRRSERPGRGARISVHPFVAAAREGAGSGLGRATPQPHPRRVLCRKRAFVSILPPLPLPLSTAAESPRGGSRQGAQIRQSAYPGYAAYNSLRPAALHASSRRQPGAGSPRDSASTAAR